jgi:hypothetical protein
MCLYVYMSICYTTKNTEQIFMKFYQQVVHKIRFWACELSSLLQVIFHMKMKENSVLLFLKKFPIYKTFILFIKVHLIFTFSTYVNDTYVVCNQCALWPACGSS